MNPILKIFSTSSFVCSGGLFTFHNKLSAESSSKLNENYNHHPCLDNKFDAKKIAVIGTGIGGCSTSHFLRQLLGENATIDVYEKSDRIGGRIDTITLNGQTVESGGTYMLNSNNYLLDFVEKTKLEKNGTSHLQTGMGIFNGNEFVFMDTTRKWLTNLKIIWRYGPITMMRMNSFVKEAYSNFRSIYTLQDEGDSFRTVPEMLEAMGGKSFFEYTQKSCKEIMKEKGIDELVIDEVVTAMLRMRFGQNADNVNGLTGIYSMTGSQAGGIWNVKGGNYQVCQRLLKNADANLHMKSKVTGIRKEINQETGKPIYFLEGTGLVSVPYDAVVVAVPLEIPSCFMTCHGCQHWPDKKKLGKYQRTVASFVQASVNYKKFGVEKADKMPGLVLTTENKENSFSKMVPTANVNGCKTSIQSVYSRNPLSENSVKDLVTLDPTSKPVYAAISWLSNPRYREKEQFLKFQLDDGVFFVNAIERVAANMEMSAIGGKNAALLTMEYLSK